MSGTPNDPPPNIILRGCTRSTEAISYIHQAILGGDTTTTSQLRPREEEVAVPGFGTTKSAKVLCWPWGNQLWVAPYRTRSDKWWDSLLKILSARSALSREGGGQGTLTGMKGIKLLLLCAADTATSQVQMVFRAHLEDDYQTVRYILTTAADTYMERSLESRCVAMVPEKETRWNDTMLLLERKVGDPPTWPQVKNAWLADIPAYRVLDATFEPLYMEYVPGSRERREIAIAWCRYADLLKSCYQEVTILRKAWEWIQKYHQKNPIPVENDGVRGTY